MYTSDGCKHFPPRKTGCEVQTPQPSAAKLRCVSCAAAICAAILARVDWPQEAHKAQEALREQAALAAAESPGPRDEETPYGSSVAPVLETAHPPGALRLRACLRAHALQPWMLCSSAAFTLRHNDEAPEPLLSLQPCNQAWCAVRSTLPLLQVALAHVMHSVSKILRV